MGHDVNYHGRSKTDGMLNKKGEKVSTGGLDDWENAEISLLCLRYSLSAKEYGEWPFVSERLCFGQGIKL